MVLAPTASEGQHTLQGSWEARATQTPRCWAGVLEGSDCCGPSHLWILNLAHSTPRKNFLFHQRGKNQVISLYRFVTPEIYATRLPRWAQFPHFEKKKCLMWFPHPQGVSVRQPLPPELSRRHWSHLKTSWFRRVIFVSVMVLQFLPVFLSLEMWYLHGSIWEYVGLGVASHLGFCLFWCFKSELSVSPPELFKTPILWGFFPKCSWDHKPTRLSPTLQWLIHFSLKLLSEKSVEKIADPGLAQVA